ncbi:MAG: bifunctional (p)ppGpp synthetase/guanosine-3',5'-bis(diphosphate) 3'-pyrophosphohydrolase [Oscillospiraceae bacterium]|jgi:GTP pyrophosphokinase|nr:bifunctional (p)ppGpp synthetase/guanosine-3',5'-bis(diphosphate) 3'-pyrophosphohydrolase [Oscillospiraceae bacterium]
MNQQAQERYEALRERCKALNWQDSSRKVFNGKDLHLIDKAFRVAEEAHSGAERQSGEPYIFHPIAVAELLVDLGLYDRDCLAAALLHDVVEDTDLTDERVREMFGDHVAHMVQGLSKLKKFNFPTEERAQAENVLKMLLAMLRDYRVIVVKLADRLHNMRTLEFKSEAAQRRIAKETMDIYVPIADMLGIRLFKEELEDLAIRYLDPPGYHEIEEKLALEREARASFLEKIQNTLAEYLQGRFGANKKFHVEGRVKSVRGIHRKLYEQHRNFEEIFDIYAVRVIVDTVQECWEVFGWVHDIYREIPGRYKNYISAPKRNGYQSLHLTMLGEEKIPFEIQIRTWDMHNTAERGVAAHWKYKLGLNEKATGLEERLARVQELLDSYKDADAVEEVVQSIKNDMAPQEKVYPRTPKGEVKELKAGATVLDFAYAVHTKVGHRTIGAKVNYRPVPISCKVKTGDVVEILVSPNEDKGPSRDWQRIVVTAQAQSKIRAWFKKERREENIVEGRRAVEAELRRSCSRLEPGEWGEFLLRLLDRKHFDDEAKEKKAPAQRLDDFYAALGYGGITLQSYLPIIREEYQKRIKEQQQELTLKKITSDKGVTVEGIDSCQVKFAQCCHPLPGDPIIGYITRGAVRDRGSGPEHVAGGVTIHNQRCGNVPRDIARAPEPDRWLSAHWAEKGRTNYLGALTIHTVNKTGMTADITGMLKNLHVDISEFLARANPDGTGTVYATIGVSSRDQLESIRGKLLQIRGVTEIL